MALNDTIRNRRMIRKYRDEQITDEQLNLILEAYDLGVASAIIGRAEMTLTVI